MTSPPAPSVAGRFRVIRTVLTRLGFLLGRLGPVRRRVVLGSSHTAGLTGNLAFIRAELERRGLPVTVLAPGSRETNLGRVAFLVRAGYHLASARVFVVDDYFFPMYVITPRAGTCRIQVWHAAGAFKKFGYSVVDKTFGADEALLTKVRIHSNYDAALVSAMAFAPHYAEAFGTSAAIFTSATGIPRTDLLCDPDRRATAEAAVRARYPQLAGKKVVLYAPTFRGDSVRQARDGGFLDLDTLHEVLGDDWAVLLKLHPFIRKGLSIPESLRAFAIDASGEPDINALMLVADVLVSDYSSVIYEYALLGRPILFLAPDEGAYDVERGFYFDFRRDAPGPIFGTTEDLARAIRDGVHDLDRVRAFADASFDVADGQATARLVDRLLLPALRSGRVDVARLARPEPAPETTP